ncbi:sugar ABC transporter permease [Bifidobacterium sp. 82T10]|uniref:Sugar ABC transporter permease n=1 Tax=Bifidobacterium miconis TaxID=2834435 RepID=A0ABS6WEQ2_9BIFI|nr:sugar ABC transporter permease [Bifidobacterium miconis]MBW3092518.1 sugar ABC transporter permease [Bifidobacterium miconis]
MTSATANPATRNNLKTKAQTKKPAFKINTQMIPTIAAVVIFICMIIMGQALFGTYTSLGFISSLFIDHAYLIILAVAMTLPVLTGGIDLSIGAIVAICGVVGMTLLNQGVNSWLVIVIMLLIGLAFGAIAGTLIEEFNMQPFIATLSTMFLARGIAAMISTDSLIAPENNNYGWIATTIKIIDNPKIKNDLSINAGVIIAAIVVAGGYILLHKTRTGRTIYAIGGSRSSAELMGLPVKRTQRIIYLTSGTLAALAAIVYTANIGSAKNTVGVGWELDAVASVVIGGTIVTGGFGYVLGSVIGALVRSTIDPLTSDFGVPSEWTTIVVGLMILIFVVLQRAVTAVGKKE